LVKICVRLSVGQEAGLCLLKISSGQDSPDGKLEAGEPHGKLELAGMASDLLLVKVLMEA